MNWCVCSTALAYVLFIQSPWQGHDTIWLQSFGLWSHTAADAGALSTLELRPSKPRICGLVVTILPNVCNHILRLKGNGLSVLNQENLCTHRL